MNDKARSPASVGGKARRSYKRCRPVVEANPRRSPKQAAEHAARIDTERARVERELLAKLERG